jgi:hypothetical protein
MSKRFGAIAQLGERLVRNEEVAGPIPVGSTKTKRIRTLKKARIFVLGGNHADFDEFCGNSLFSVSDQRC